MKTVIGIDPSSKKLAVCSTVFEDNLMFTSIRLPAGMYLATGAAYREVFSFLDFGGEQIIYMEAPLVGKNVHSTLVQAQVGGAVMAAAENFGTVLKLVHPSTWKKKVLGNGNSKKPAIADWLEKNWPEAYDLAEGDQDLIDAACINRYGVLHERMLSRRIRARKTEEAAAQAKR